MANLTQIELPNGQTYNLQDTISGYVATDATTSAHGLMSASDKTKLNGIASGAEVNQNAFSNVVVGSTTVAADSKTDTLTLVGGANITLTPDATNDKITILLDDTVDTGEVIATDIQAGNLIVNGTSRFLNTINGTASNSEKLNGQSLTSTYSSTGTAPITGAAVASAIGTLDGTVSGSPSASKTLTAFSQTDGKVSATFGNISITKSQVSDFPTLGTAAAKNYTTSVTNGSADLVTSGAVWTAIDNLPEPMVFKGSLGTGGTITDLPVNGSASIGDTYKVIEAKTYAGKAAKVGDTFICLTKTSSANTWELIPSGDEPSGTVTSVGISNGGGLSVSGSPITSSGTITISHADTSSQASVNNSGRTYIQDITLDTYGHVTGITSATETVVNTDRYVNSAAFAHDSTNDNVKMTLTRAGSDTATVAANIPKVSSSSAGVAPKGATVSSQSQTTKFLREDGTWQAPSYTPVIDNLTSSTSTTSALSAKQGYLLANGSARDNTKLPLAGGTMTGLLKAQANIYTDSYTGALDMQNSNIYGVNSIITADLADNAGEGIHFYRDSTHVDTLWVAGGDIMFVPNRALGTSTTAANSQKVGRFTANPTSGQVVITDGTTGGMKSSGYTIAKSVPSDAKFTDTTYSAGTGLSLSGTTFSVNNSTISPFEANLQWGGKNFPASYGCLDAALMDELGANRFQFIKASAITVEYTRDGGSTWTDYGATDAQKQQIFAQGGNLVIGKADSTNKATANGENYQLRITIDTGVANVYSVLNKFVVYCSTNGSAACKCKIQKALQSTPTTFVDHTDFVDIGGWSGYNVINTGGLTTYGNTASSQYGRVRFIFKANGGNTSYSGLSIFQIKAFGGVGWSTPSTMAKTGHIYSIDESQNATFPATLKSTGDIYEAGSKLSDKYSAKTGNANYVRVKNSSTVGQSSSFTFNDLAKQHFAMGMIYSGTDSPTGTNGWHHGISMAWEDGVNTSWVSQIAIGVSAGTGMWYRTNSGTIIGRTWNKLLDDSNYTTYTVKKDGTGASGTWGISISGNAATATSASNLSGFTNTTTSGTAIDSATQNGHVYVTGTSGIYSVSDGAAFVQAYSASWVAQIYQDYRTGQIALRGRNNGTWQAWRKVWDSVNLTSKTAAASGTDLSLVTTGEKATWNAKPSTDTKNTAGSTDTSSKIFLIGATSQAANPQTYSDDQVYVTSGTLQANNISSTINVTGVTLGVNSTSGTTGGFCLYGGATNTASYGIAMRTTANSGKHGYVQGDWGTYFYMAGATNRGWVFQNAGSGNRTSISCEGHIVTNGSLTLGGNTTNTSGVRQVYNETTKSLDFVFVA